MSPNTASLAPTWKQETTTDQTRVRRDDDNPSDRHDTSCNQAVRNCERAKRSEKGADHRISTLRRIVEALGGELELVVKVGDERVVLDV